MRGSLLVCALLGTASGYNSGITKPILETRPASLSRTSPLVAQQGPLEGLRRTFSGDDRQMQIQDYSPAAAVPVALSNSAALAAALTAFCFASPAIWGAFISSSTMPSGSMSGFLGGAAASAGFSFAFTAIARSAGEEAKMEDLQRFNPAALRSGSFRDVDVSSSGFVASGAAVAACFASPAIWKASTAAFTSSIVPSASLSAFLGVNFGFAAAASLAFYAIADEAKFGYDSRFNFGRSVRSGSAAPVAITSSAAFAAACTAASFAAPAVWGSFSSYIFPSDALTAFGSGAAAATTASFAYSAVARTAVEQARLDALYYRSRDSFRRDSRGADVSIYGSMAGGAAVAACFATPAIWAASTAAFTSSTVPSTSLGAFLGASFAFASAASVAFYTAGQAAEEADLLSPYGQPNEQDPQYRVRGMDRASLGGTRQFDPRQFDPRQLGTRGGGTRYGGTSNNLAFAERQVYAQRQRDNDRRAELRRESDRRDRRDRYYDRPLESERYQGVVKPTARQRAGSRTGRLTQAGVDARPLEPKSAEWRQSQRYGSYRDYRRR